ncbi:hypothetical protein [Undibacterium sp. CY21W]|uniref:hypothetical protein n=1 Tax=Undibacterium sp. CY21W TaxID=2762293 RepID=UPI00164A6EAC|nr:hypothetical protein [Undibacterium sp. CY21W]MBC3928948.1 hypothetical protein [Undibacterium sp. CY21W]
MKLINLLLACLLASNAQAGWIDKQGKPLHETEDAKANGDFGALLIFTTNEEALFKNWATPSESVYFDTVESVKINQPVSAFVIFSGCKTNLAGNCNVSMRFRIIQPDGKVYSETPAMEVWNDKPAPTGRSLRLSVDYLKVVIEPHEQRGRYTVMAQVRDDNAGAVLNLQKTFIADDSPSKAKHNPALKRVP